MLDTKLKVASLIDNNSGNWFINILQELVLQHEVDIIKGIPLSMEDEEDKLIWDFTPNGNFSVNSAYKVARKMERRGRGKSREIINTQFIRYMEEIMET